MRFCFFNPLRFLSISGDSPRQYPVQSLALAISTLGILILGCQPYHAPSYPRRPSENIRKSLESVSFRNTFQNWGSYYTVRKGDTVYKIARQYDVAPFQIMKINKLSGPGNIEAGQSLFIPGNKIATGTTLVSARTPLRRAGGLSFSAPMQGARVVKNNEMIITASHEGSVYAAEDGLVAFSDTLRGYGSTIIIEHPGGLSTVYANLSKSYTAPHARVRRGQQIGEVSLAGNNNILRFQIRRGQHVLDPRNYLR